MPPEAGMAVSDGQRQPPGPRHQARANSAGQDVQPRRTRSAAVPRTRDRPKSQAGHKAKQVRTEVDPGLTLAGSEQGQEAKTKAQGHEKRAPPPAALHPTRLPAASTPTNPNTPVDAPRPRCAAS